MKPKTKRIKHTVKIVYHGYELEAHIEPSLGGESLLYYSAFSPSGTEIVSNFSTGSDTPTEQIEFMKGWVDEWEADKK